MQYRDATIVYTDLAGKAYALSYSPTGDYLVVQTAVSGTDSHGASQVSLVDGTGGIVWTKSDERSFSFSTTGQVLYAWQAPDVHGPSPRLEVFGLDGTSLRAIEIDSRPIMAAAVFGSGDRVVLGFGTGAGGSLQCLAVSSNALNTLWTVGLNPSDAELESLVPLDGSRLILKQVLGYFKVINADGVIEFSYDPGALGSDDPVRDPVDYAQYQPYPGGVPGEVILFDGTTRGFRVDLSTGVLSERTLDVTTPDGFTLRKAILGGKILLVGASQIRIRAVAT
jgi:hypothetical protein